MIAPPRIGFSVISGGTVMAIRRRRPLDEIDRSRPTAHKSGRWWSPSDLRNDCRNAVETLNA